MRVLVTGGTGFVGYNLVSQLQQSQHDVVCLVRETSNLRWLNSLGNIEYVYGDVLLPESLEPAVQNVDWIIHLAATVAPVKRSDFFRINHLGTRNLIETTYRHNPDISRFVMMSSLSAAGPSTPDTPKTESMPDYPVSAYGESKLAAERAVLDFGEKLPVTVARAPIVYGPRDVGVLRFFNLVQSGWQIKFLRHKLYLSLIYVDDLVQALIKLARSDLASGELFYVSDPAQYSVPQIQHMIAQALDRETRQIPIPKFILYPAAAGSELLIKLRKKPSFLNLDKMKELTQPAWTCSSEKIAKTLGFHAETGLTEGAAETADWYRAHGWI